MQLQVNKMRDKLPIILLMAIGGGLGLWWYMNRGQQPVSLPGLPPGSVAPKTNIIADALTDANLMVKSLNSIGIRNNNPLNIRATANSRKNPWVGQNGEAGGFVRFIKPEYGFRAGARLLDTYLSEGVNTIAAIMARWAPKEDGNDPVKYAANVSKWTGIPTYRPVSRADYALLMKAMARQETGKDYDLPIVLLGISLMNVQTPKGKA